MIPVSVIVMTKNEADILPHSLPSLVKNFDQVFVVDSHSTDGTQTIARDLGATVVDFTWDGQYPKKKEWCIDHLPLRHDWVFLCDADEMITEDFIDECRALDFTMDGYFVSSTMIWNGRPLKFGAKNNKLCMFQKNAFTHPVVDDLNNVGGWEVEGHYQPIPTIPNPKIGHIKSPIRHSDTSEQWTARHEKYIAWEVGMIRRNAFPRDPIQWRETIKRLTRTSRLRPFIHFIYGFIFKMGFLDGRAGMDYAVKRFWYNHRIARAIRQSNFER